MGKDKDFSVFIKSEYVLNFFSCVVYSRSKAFGEKMVKQNSQKN